MFVSSCHSESEVCLRLRWIFGREASGRCCPIAAAFMKFMMLHLTASMPVHSLRALRGTPSALSDDINVQCWVVVVVVVAAKKKGRT